MFVFYTGKDLLQIRAYNLVSSILRYPSVVTEFSWAKIVRAFLRIHSHYQIQTLYLPCKIM